MIGKIKRIIGSLRLNYSSGFAQIPLIIGLLLMAVAIPAATKLVQQSSDTRNLATGACPQDPPQGGCGNPACCRGWEDYQNGCCKSLEGCDKDSDCANGEVCRNHACGNAPTPSCDKCTYPSDASESSPICRNSKTQFCGNDWCWHTIDTRNDPTKEKCVKPTNTPVPVVPTVKPAVDCAVFCKDYEAYPEYPLCMNQCALSGTPDTWKCVPGQTKCKDGKLDSCKIDGTDWVTSDCVAGYECKDGATGCSSRYTCYSNGGTCNSVITCVGHVAKTGTCMTGNVCCDLGAMPKTCDGKPHLTTECLSSGTQFRMCENGNWVPYNCASGYRCPAGGSGCAVVCSGTCSIEPPSIPDVVEDVNAKCSGAERCWVTQIRKPCGTKPNNTTECYGGTPTDQGFNMCVDGTWVRQSCGTGLKCPAGGSGCVAQVTLTPVSPTLVPVEMASGSCGAVGFHCHSERVSALCGKQMNYNTNPPSLYEGNRWVSSQDCGGAKCDESTGQCTQPTPTPVPPTLVPVDMPAGSCGAEGFHCYSERVSALCGKQMNFNTNPPSLYEGNRWVSSQDCGEARCDESTGQCTRPTPMPAPVVSGGGCADKGGVCKLSCDEEKDTFLSGNYSDCVYYAGNQGTIYSNGSNPEFQKCCVPKVGVTVTSTPTLTPAPMCYCAQANCGGTCYGSQERAFQNPCYDQVRCNLVTTPTVTPDPKALCGQWSNDECDSDGECGSQVCLDLHSTGKPCACKVVEPTPTGKLVACAKGSCRVPGCGSSETDNGNSCRTYTTGVIIADGKCCEPKSNPRPCGTGSCVTNGSCAANNMTSVGGATCTTYASQGGFVVDGVCCLPKTPTAVLTPAAGCKLTASDPAGCCCSNADCPGTQQCSIPNGACSSGTSCNPNPGNKMKKKCAFDASQNKNICGYQAVQPGESEADECTTNAQCNAILTPIPTPTGGWPTVEPTKNPGTTPPPATATTNPDGGTTAPAACYECPRDFECYQNQSGTDYKWFVTGYVMNGYVKVAGESQTLRELKCNQVGVLKPTFKGKDNADADCNGYANGADYSIWRSEFLDHIKTNGRWEARFTTDPKFCKMPTDLSDYSAWRTSFFDKHNDK